MPCYSPRKGYYSSKLTKSGKRKLVFSAAQAVANAAVSLFTRGSIDTAVLTVKCGKCIGCRLEYARQWAIRSMNEAQFSEHSHFITLTYRDHLLPTLHGYPSLRPRDFTLFMKKLRKVVGPGVRFLMCGEYGEKLGRPHFHALLFNCPLNDLKIWKTVNGYPLFKSAFLEKTWGKGYCPIGTVTFQSASYVSRYITKKISGDLARDHYSRPHPDTGEVISIHPEFSRMSNRPGIGADFFHRYYKEIYDNDSVIINEREVRPPVYYDRLLERLDPKLYASVKLQRRLKPRDLKEESYERLTVREQVAKLNFLKLIRSFESDI